MTGATLIRVTLRTRDTEIGRARTQRKRGVQRKRNTPAREGRKGTQSNSVSAAPPKVKISRYHLQESQSFANDAKDAPWEM